MCAIFSAKILNIFLSMSPIRIIAIILIVAGYFYYSKQPATVDTLDLPAATAGVTDNGEVIPVSTTTTTETDQVSATTTTE